MEEKIISNRSREIIRISITGPESTGKTTLAEELATHYHTAWVPEYARQYLSKLNRDYSFDDILHIARQQFKMEQERIPGANRFLFCDTDFIVLKIWCEVKFGRCHQWIEKMASEHIYDLYLLTYPDIKWEYDALREDPHLRRELFNNYQKQLQKLRVNYRIITGTGSLRMQKAVEMIDRMHG